MTFLYVLSDVPDQLYITTQPLNDYQSDAVFIGVWEQPFIVRLARTHAEANGKQLSEYVFENVPKRFPYPDLDEAIDYINDQMGYLVAIDLHDEPMLRAAARRLRIPLDDVNAAVQKAR